MLDCTFVLSARWADQFEIVATGKALGADERELLAVMLDRHHADICAVGGPIDSDARWGVDHVGDGDADLRWRDSNLGPVLTATIPCRIACAGHPDVEAPQVQIEAMFVPWEEPNLERKPPTTVIGAFLAQFRRRRHRSWRDIRRSELVRSGLVAHDQFVPKRRNRSWHPSLGPRRPVRVEASSPGRSSYSV